MSAVLMVLVSEVDCVKTHDQQKIACKLTPPDVFHVLKDQTVSSTPYHKNRFSFLISILRTKQNAELAFISMRRRDMSWRKTPEGIW